MTSTKESSKSLRPSKSIIFPALLGAALVTPNLAVIALGIEDFPFTVAPMFAHYIGPETELYSFRFEGVQDGVAVTLPLNETNRGERELKRAFAKYYYQPMTSSSPYRSLGIEITPDRLAEQMKDFFEPITDFLANSRDLQYERINIYVDIHDSAGMILETTYVGCYDVVASQYVHIYEAPSS